MYGLILAVVIDPYLQRRGLNWPADLYLEAISIEDGFKVALDKYDLIWIGSLQANFNSRICSRWRWTFQK